MKHLRGYEKFKESRKISENLNPVNEEFLGQLFGGLKELFGKVWDMAVSGMIKALGDNPEPDKIKTYLDENILDPNKPTFIFKAVVPTQLENIPLPASIQVVNLPTGEQTAVLP